MNDRSRLETVCWIIDAMIPLLILVSLFGWAIVEGRRRKQVEVGKA